MKLLGLTGYKQSGKDTVAGLIYDLLESRDRREVFIFSHANELRKIVYGLYGLSYEQMTDPARKEVVVPELGRTPRQILQDVGLKLREQDPEVFIRPMNAAIKETKRSYGFSGVELVVVVTDCRFQNEVNNINAQGGEVWRISRGERTDMHASEDIDSLVGISKTIQNYGDLEVLKDKVLKALNP